MELDINMSGRSLKTVEVSCDFVVVGGGLAGVCAAISAARRGIKVCLVNDRPVLGGNASSEIRVWALGATSHMGNNNRFSREGGIVDEILSENLYRNKEGNPFLFDMVLMDKVLAEPEIRLLLNTVVYDVEMETDGHGRRIAGVVAFCPSSETRYVIRGHLFADCSGDGIVSHLSGVTYRVGAEAKDVYGEGFAPDVEQYGELMGDSILFYMKDAGHPVKYVAPDFALKDVEGRISKIHNANYFNTAHHGCKYWWLEWGGRMDTVHDTEIIKRELWSVVYGLWDYIKNSGKFPEMENYTLEWVGAIPGKRESRRMKGLYTLTQNDIVGQKEHYDAVSYGGWAIDLHPADGVYAPGPACNQWHSKGIYQIPYRCFVGDEVDNLFFGGRIISASHVANGSARVMCTAAHGGAVIGTAAALCIYEGVAPLYYSKRENVGRLRIALEETGHFVPGFCDRDDENMLNSAEIQVSSTYGFEGFRPEYYRRLEFSTALMFPVRGKIPAFNAFFETDKETKVTVSLRVADKVHNYTPEITLDTKVIHLGKGKSVVEVAFDVETDVLRNVFVTFEKNTDVKIGMSDRYSPGVVTVLNQINEAVSNYGRQDAPEGIGFDSFEFWCPQRRPQAGNIALQFREPIDMYLSENLMNTYKRPYIGTNAWAADPDDSLPTVTLNWQENKEINRMVLFFDNDFDHAMEPIQMGHYENVMPLCVPSFRVYDAGGNRVYECRNNHYATAEIRFDRPLMTDRLVVEIDHPEMSPASMFHIIVK